MPPRDAASTADRTGSSAAMDEVTLTRAIHALPAELAVWLDGPATLPRLLARFNHGWSLDVTDWRHESNLLLIGYPGVYGSLPAMMRSISVFMWIARSRHGLTATLMPSTSSCTDPRTKMFSSLYSLAGAV